MKRGSRKSRRDMRIQRRNTLRLCSTLFLALLIAGMVVFLSRVMPRSMEKKAQSAEEAPASYEAAATPAQSTPEPTQMPEVVAQSAEASMEYGFQSAVIGNDGVMEMYERDARNDFADPDAYAAVEGITTFGAGPFRSSFAYGTQHVSSKTLTRIWEKEVGSLQTAGGDVWQGTGWTGMPLIVKWDAQVRKTLGIQDSFKQKEDFIEVIYPTADGNIYFFELESGAPTREPIRTNVVMKGTALLDPRGYPMLYVGQGVEDEVDGRGAWLRAVSLIENKVVWSFGGVDRSAHRDFQAYDGSALLDPTADTLFVPGENGILYSVVLHTAFDAQAGTISISPEPLVKYRYSADSYGTDAGMRVWGIESSVAALGEFAFLTDNGGFLQCVDLNRMCLVYAVDLINESDATVVISREDGEAFLYTATLAGRDASAYLRKHDAKTGRILWEEKQAVVDTGDASDTRGALGTPHVGRGGIENLVIFNCTMIPYSEDGNENGRGGCVLALDKKTGEEKWRYEQPGGCWSSPVVIYDENEKAYVIQCDRTGWMRLLDAATGELLTSLDMGSRIESTPAVFGDTLVVGTRGQYGSGEKAKIIGVKIG